MLSATPKPSIQKIKLAPKRGVTAKSSLLVMLVGSCWLLVSVCSAPVAAPNSASVPVVQVGGERVPVELAASDVARVNGLSGRSSLKAGTGMLFVFDQSSRWCFWMKDMHFSLDIVWLDGDGMVVHIASAVSPATYPTTFCPNKSARYVLELNTGEVVARDIAIGERLLLPIPSP